MDDLIHQYFRRDITEAEEEAISQRLLSSDEDAMAFREEAGRIYEKYGLPQPQWRGVDDAWPSPRSAWKQWNLFWALLTVVIVAAGWWLASQGNFFRDLNARMERPAPPTPVLSKPALARKKTIAHPTGSPATSPSPALSAAPPLVSPAPVMGTPARFSAPKPVLAQSNHPANQPLAYSNLSVMVRRPTPGEITVRVLNEGGAEVALLYRGTLEAGSWVFEWDGKLVDGRPAGTGVYSIEVKSGETVQRKSLKIK